VELSQFEETVPSRKGGTWDPVGKCYLSVEGAVNWQSEERLTTYYGTQPGIIELFPHAFSEHDAEVVFGKLHYRPVYGRFNALVVGKDLQGQFGLNCLRH